MFLRATAVGGFWRVVARALTAPGLPSRLPETLARRLEPTPPSFHSSRAPVCRHISSLTPPPSPRMVRKPKAAVEVASEEPPVVAVEDETPKLTEAKKRGRATGGGKRGGGTSPHSPPPSETTVAIDDLPVKGKRAKKTGGKAEVEEVLTVVQTEVEVVVEGGMGEVKGKRGGRGGGRGGGGGGGAGRGRGRGKADANDDVAVAEGEDQVASSEPWTMLVHKKAVDGWVPYNPGTMRAPPVPAGENVVKIVSWNVNGLKALLKNTDGMVSMAEKERPDVICLQELKLQEKDVETVSKGLLADYPSKFWSCSTAKLGYSGTAIFSKREPLNVSYGLGLTEHDGEGRVITAEYDTFFLVTAYVPNAGEKLVRLDYRVKEWDPAFASHIKTLEAKKPVVVTGDLNCAYEEIDIYNPDGNKKSAGFTKEERESFGANFLNKGLTDTFRKQHPSAVGYTYWGYRTFARSKNQGWRLDYFLVSEAIASNVHDSFIVPDIGGSDHCPIGIVLKL